MSETDSELQERLFLHHGHAQISTGYEDDKSMPSKNEVVVMDHTDQLHDGVGFSQYMIAGSIAGMVEHMAMFPVDTLKTRMQMLASAGGSSHSALSRSFISIMKAEGPLGFYRGIGAMGLGAGPAHAVYFSVYELCKNRFGGNRAGHHPVAHAAAGIVATLASDAVFTPMDVVKQRLQLSGSPYRGVTDCMRVIFQEEGVRAFYASYRTTVVMNAPFTAVHFSTYEAMKKVLMDISPEKASEEHLIVHTIAGGAAGALAGAVTTPLDVVKTRLQCQGVNGAERFSNSSIGDALKKIIAKEGLAALLKGLKARVLFHTPAAAICWSTYESTKSFLQRWNRMQAR
eukprot:c24897_g1_i1 orf=1510-2538(+)